jgi:hypothetical protein
MSNRNPPGTTGCAGGVITGMNGDGAHADASRNGAGNLPAPSLRCRVIQLCSRFGLMP